MKCFLEWTVNCYNVWRSRKHALLRSDRDCEVSAIEKKSIRFVGFILKDEGVIRYEISFEEAFNDPPTPLSNSTVVNTLTET